MENQDIMYLLLDEHPHLQGNTEFLKLLKSMAFKLYNIYLYNFKQHSHY